MIRLVAHVTAYHGTRLQFTKKALGFIHLYPWKFLLFKIKPTLACGSRLVQSLCRESSLVSLTARLLL